MILNILFRISKLPGQKKSRGRLRRLAGMNCSFRRILLPVLFLLLKLADPLFKQSLRLVLDGVQLDAGSQE